MASEALATGVLLNGVSKDATFECVLLTLGDVVALSTLERLAGKGVARSLVLRSAATDSRCLNSSDVRVLVLKDVGILVGRSGNLSLEGLLSKISFTLVAEALSFLVVRLIVERVTPGIVVVSDLRLVVDDIVIGVTEHIGVVLALL